MITFGTKIGQWFGQIITGANSGLTGLETIFNFIKSFINELINLFDYVLKANAIAQQFMSTLPSWLHPYAIVTVSVLILYIVVGRPAGARGR